MNKKSSRPAPRSLDLTLQRLEQRHRTLLRQFADTGLVLRGTIGKYRMRCGSPRCLCATDRTPRHGPYYIWTRKASGKTVTRMLSDEQARRLRPWIQNMRRLDRLLKKLQGLGLRAAEAVPRGLNPGS
jgi:hypothetical protein